jgi:hypothetical protein
VDEVKVEVFKTQIAECSFESRFDELRSVESVPQFARDEEIFPLYYSFIDFCFDAFTHFFFVAVDVSAIDVTISDVNRVLHGLRNFAWFRLNKKYI